VLFAPLIADSLTSQNFLRIQEFIDMKSQRRRMPCSNRREAPLIPMSELLRLRALSSSSSTECFASGASRDQPIARCGRGLRDSSSSSSNGGGGNGLLPDDCCGNAASVGIDHPCRRRTTVSINDDCSSGKVTFCERHSSKMTCTD
jgi:hypothetical protein